MNLSELIDQLLYLECKLGANAAVYIFADRDGLSAMTVESASRQKDYHGNDVVFVSAWESPTARQAMEVI